MNTVTTLASLDEVGRRLGLTEAADQQLLAAAAGRLNVPRETVPPAQISFILHAPLELLARAVLLSVVAPARREQARLRIASLVAAYEEAAPPLLASPRTGEHDSVADAARHLVDAITARDAGEVDAVAAWLDECASPGDLATHLAPTLIPSLAAAGHANIYLTLLTRPALLGASTSMLRPLVRSLATDTAEPIRVPATRVVADPDGSVGRELVRALLRVEPIGPPAVPFIATLVHHAENHGALDVLVRADADFVAPDRAPVELLRFAAQAMLQGTPDQAPYGWTHCLTLAQGALGAGAFSPEPGSAVYVAAAYLGAHWTAYGTGTLDLSYIPEPTTVPLEDALFDSPANAAAAAWHSRDVAGTAAVLASSASVNHDAHRVKYTLACLDAAAADPGARSLYLAAAASLNAWWHAHPDDGDPLPRPVAPSTVHRTGVDVTVRWYDGPRDELRALFELAEDSPQQLDGYLDDGRVLAAYADGPDPVGHLQLVPTGRAHLMELKSIAVWPTHTHRGIGRMLVERAVDVCVGEGTTELVVATGAADIGLLRFYQRLGFRFTGIERDAFVPARGYPPGLVVDGIPLRDGVRLARSLTDGNH